MKDLVTNAKAGFAMTGMTLLWIWRNWSLIMAIITFPRPPKNWSDSEAVRLFTISLLRSKASTELVKLVPFIKWGDAAREKVARLAENRTLWSLVWEFIHTPEVVTPPKRLTLRERISERLDRRRSSPELQTVTLTEVEDLITVLKALQLVYDKTSKLEI